jgi:hypothetical protein
MQISITKLPKLGATASVVLLTPHNDAVIGTGMVTSGTFKDVANLTGGALTVGVIVSGASNPVRIRVVDVLLAVGMGISQEPAGQDGDLVLAVVDVGKVGNVSVNPVGEITVADLSKPNV